MRKYHARFGGGRLEKCRFGNSLAAYPTISEFDGDDIMFGLVIGHEIELGYVSLAELKSVKGPMGLPIERDFYYEPKTLRELKEKHEQEWRG